ncbi:MAG: oligosaccharide flippase family protein [bacterium]
MLSYLFQLFAGRLLSVSDYGILVSLFSFIAILSVPSVILNTSIVKIVSELKAENSYDVISSLFLWFIKTFTVVGVFVILLSFLLNKEFLDFLNFNNPLAFMIFMLVFVVSLVLSIPVSFLQGLQKFVAFSLSNIVTALNKFLLGIGITLLTYEITGTVTGMFIGSLISFVIVCILLNRNIKLVAGADIKKWLKRLFKFALPSSLTLLSLAILFNVDVVLVKHFFDENTAGIYSSMAIIGRILFFGASTIGLVLFPLSSETHARGKDTQRVFLNSLALTMVILICGLSVFVLFPKFVVLTLFGPSYLKAVEFLPKFTIFMFFYTLIYLFSQYFLSVYKTRIGIILAIGALMEIILIWFRHNSLMMVIDNLIYANVSLFVVLLGYYLVSLKVKRAKVIIKS